MKGLSCETGDQTLVLREVVFLSRELCVTSRKRKAKRHGAGLVCYSLLVLFNPLQVVSNLPVHSHNAAKLKQCRPQIHSPTSCQQKELKSENETRRGHVWK